MFTFIFWIVLSCFHPTQALIEFHKDILATTEVLGSLSSQIVSLDNGTKFKEFADIFNRYVSLTVREKKFRELLSRLTTVNATDDDDKQDQHGSLVWQDAINDALADVNITSYVLNNDAIIKHIQTIASSPEKLKELHLQRLDSGRNQSHYKGYGDNDLYTVDPEVTVGPETAASKENPFWEADDAPTRRIYRGQRAKIKHYPFVVSVLVLSVFACAGSIIKDDLVITAASCLQLAHNNRFFRENPILIEVRVGSLYFIVGGEVIPITEVYFHPTYNPKTLRHNLAIMRLRWVLSFKHRNVKKIDFDKKASPLPENTPPITIIGWGAMTESNKLYYRQSLHMTSLDFYDHHSCKEVYGKKYLTQDNFCAGFMSRGEGACNHDVGDPGVSGRYLVGVTSFGSPVCGRPDTPTVFTKVGFYADWIEDIIEQEVPRLRFSTTSERPDANDKPIIMYGPEGEDAPIALARDGVETETAKDTAAVDADLQIVLSKLKKLGIENTANEDQIRSLRIGTDEKTEMYPIEEQDPEIKYNGPSIEGSPVIQLVDTDQTADEENENALREDDQDNEEELNKPPEKRDWSSSESESSTKNPLDHATKIDDLDKNLSTSKEMQKSDIDNDVRVTKLPEEDVSADNSATDEVNSVETISTHNENSATDEVNLVETISTHNENSATDEFNSVETISTHKGGKHETDFDNLNLNKNKVPSNKKVVNTLTKKHRKPTTVKSQFKDTYVPKQSAKQVVQKEYTPKITPPNILGNIRPIDLGYDDRNLSAKHHEVTPYEDKIQGQIPDKKIGISSNGLKKNILKDYQESKPKKKEIRDHNKFQAELADQLADDIVKREIQKLIKQLDKSSEANSQSEERELTENTYNNPLRNDQMMSTDKSDDSDTILTFLYLNDKDTENRIQKRAQLSSNEEGLSIDTRPFKKGTMRHRGNDLVGKSEIYEIFANVMNTVVNRTLA